jgi:hypothetical protein
MVRILPITDGPGGLLADARLRILSVMLYPEDEQACCDLHASIVSRALVEDGCQDEQVNRHARLYGERWKSALPRYAQAWAAGELLLLVLNVAVFSPRDATLHRAIHLHRRDRGGGHTYEGRLIPVSQRSLRGAWNEFKSVAHLAAAHTLLQPRNEFGMAAGLRVELPEIPRLLAVGELLRIMGERTLLDGDRVWRPPVDLVLPKVKIQIPPLTDFAQEELKNYQKS